MAASTQLRAFIPGVINPTTTSTTDTIGVSTTTDTGNATSPKFSVTAATSVSAVSAVESPTTATSAQTGTGVTFTAKTALSGVDGSAVNVTFPASFSLSNIETCAQDLCGPNSVLTDTTTSERITTLSSVSGQTATFTLGEGQVVNAGDSLSLWVEGVRNPTSVPSSQPKVQIATTSDTTPVSSNALAITAAKSVTAVAVTNTGPSAGTGSPTDYSLSFTTSSTGALSSIAGSSVTVTFPTGFNTSQVACYGVSDCPDLITDLTTGAVVGSLSGTGATVTGTIVCCQQTSVTVGDTLQLVMHDVVNASTASTADAVKVETSSDNASAVASNKFSVVASHAAGKPTLALTPTAAAGAVTTYVATFATSTTGGLAGADGASVTVNLPSAATYSYTGSVSLFDQTTGQALTSYSSPDLNGSAVTIPLESGTVANPGDVLTATIGGVTNPSATGTVKVTVSTSSDTVSAASNTVTVTAQKAVSGVAVKVTGPTTAAGALTGYAVSFTTSSTGALSGTAGSSVTMTFPTGFATELEYTSSLIDTSTGAVVGALYGTGSTSAEATIGAGSIVNAGDTLTADLNGVINSTTTGTAYTVSVNTSSDKAAVSGKFSVTAAGKVTSVKNVLTGPTDVASALTGYQVTFTTPSSGALSPAVGSALTVTLPSGFSAGNNESWSILDKTTGTNVGSCLYVGECYYSSTLASFAAGQGR